MKATYIDHMGDDLTVVNDARVSFGKESKFFSDADHRLISFLARGCTSGEWEKFQHLLMANEMSQAEIRDLLQHIKRMPTHWTPFAGSVIKIHVKLPIFMRAQFVRSEQGRVYSEVSRRYVDDEPEFFVPDVWRKRAENVKQGSSDRQADLNVRAQETVWYRAKALEHYQDLLDSGVCPEQARMVLPQSTYTELRVTGSLYYWANLYNQRVDPHAQREWEVLTKDIAGIVGDLFPVSWKELTK